MSVQIKVTIVGIFVAVLTILSFVAATPVQAALITNENIAEQKIAVQYATIRTLEEQIRLFQMIFIQRLEIQVRNMEAMLATR